MAGLKRRGSKQESGGDKPKITCDNLNAGQDYEARLVYVADLGLHKAFGDDEKPDVQKIALGYEVIGEVITMDGVEKPRLLWDQPLNIYWQLTELGTELKVYKVFNPNADSGEEAEWEKYLGTPVSLTVKHVKDKKDPTILYDNIASIQPIPKKYQKDVGKGKLECAIGDADDGENPATKALYGLTNWFYERRIVESGAVEETPVIDMDDEDLPF